MALQPLFANNDGTTLALPVSNVDVTATLNSGSGTLFPSPGSNEFFPLTLISASDATVFEITYVTARSGDVVTILRAQEGTSAQAWNAGDLAQNLLTAGVMRLLVSDFQLGAYGQCRLQYVSSTQIVLNPYNGHRLTINGTNQAVPQVGVTLGNSGLTALTVYYVYAFMSGSTMTLEASVTGHVTDTSVTNYGVEIKSGDATRTLVGAVYMNSGTPGTFSDTPTFRGVATWFNRRHINTNVAITNAQTASSAFVEIGGTAFRITVFTWNDGLYQQVTGYGSCPGGSGSLATYQCLSDGIAIGQPTVVQGVPNQTITCSYGVTQGEGAHILSGQFESGGSGGTIIFNGANIVVYDA